MLTLRFPTGRWGFPGGRMVWLGYRAEAWLCLLSMASSVSAQDEGTSKSKSRHSPARRLRQKPCRVQERVAFWRIGQDRTGQGHRGAAEPATGIPADPSKSTKVAPVEIFRDPRARSWWMSGNIRRSLHARSHKRTSTRSKRWPRM